MAPGNLDCLVEIRAVEQVEADDYLLNLGEGPASANVDAGRVAPGREDCAWLSRPLPAETARTSTSFTIFEGTSEIQRMIIGRAVSGLNVR
jgi:hypothetical protein